VQPITSGETYTRSTEVSATQFAFKSNAAAFEYACKFCGSELPGDHAVTALIIDPPAIAAPINRFTLVHSTYASWKRQENENIFPTHVIRVADGGNGLEAIGVCYNKSTVFAFGELVFWIPLRQITPEIPYVTSATGLWVGAITARLSPKMSINGSWTVLESFPGRLSGASTEIRQPKSKREVRVPCMEPTCRECGGYQTSCSEWRASSLLSPPFSCLN
jgi:hypothetical protein